MDFTWEREWRIKVPEPGLRVVLQEDWRRTPFGAIVVETDRHVDQFAKLLTALKAGAADPDDYNWADTIRIVSLETIEREFRAGKTEYGRLDTWPDKRSKPASNAP